MRRPFILLVVLAGLLQMVHMSPAGAVESVAPLELLNAGSSTHTTPLGISSDGRYVLVSANAGGTKLRVDRLTGQQLEVDRSARLLSADGQVIVGPQLVNGNPTQVRREDLRSGAVQVFPTPGGSSIVRGIDEVSAISADGNVIVLTVIDGGRGSVEVWGLDARNGNVIEPASGFGAGTTYASFGGSISANGRFLTWVQRNGVSAGCTMSDRCSEVWRYDLATGNRAVANTNAAGVEGDRLDGQPRLSADGRYLTWASNSTNVVPGATDVAARRYWKDLVSGEVRLVGATSNLNSPATISDNGERVAWTGFGAANPVIVADLSSGSTSDLTAAGTQGNHSAPTLSGNGRVLAFGSNAQGLVAGIPWPRTLTYIAQLDAVGVAPTSPPPPVTNPRGSLSTLRGDIPVVGDWDANGSDTIGVFRAGTWLLRNTNDPGGVDITIPWGAPGDLPVVGDWDGNGTDTIGVYRRGVWMLRNSNTPGPVDTSVAWGGADDLPLVGDWDGNGTDTIGAFRLGTWFLRNTNTSGGADATISWGAASDLPVAGDWDTNGTDTIGVYRSGSWLLRDSNTSGPVDRAISWGGAEDIPIPGHWQTGGTIGLGVRRLGDWHQRDTLTSGPPSQSISWGAATTVG